MAAMFGAGRSTLFDITKTPQPLPPSPLAGPPNPTHLLPSRPQLFAGNGNAAGEERDAEEARDAMKEEMDKAKEKTKGRSQFMTEKAKETAEETVEEGKEKTKGTAEEAKDKTKGTVKKGEEKARESAETVTERTKEGTAKVVEAAQSVGEKAKQTVQEAWGETKETTQKIKETVVGKPEDAGDDDPNKHKDLTCSAQPQRTYPSLYNLEC